MAVQGLVIAGLASGSGKTTVTLGFLRTLFKHGFEFCAAKAGPDYIDCAYLAASNRPAFNLDAFAMPDEMVRGLAQNAPGETLVVEGVMGLFDGTDGGKGSSVAVAAQLGAGIILVIDARHQAQTAAAIASGIATQLPRESPLVGVVLNRIASPRHKALIASALKERDIPFFGALPMDSDISVPSRHLGLVQSHDLAAQGRLDALIDAAASRVEMHLDWRAMYAAARPLALPIETAHADPAIDPPAQRIAMANDAAFGFHYVHMIDAWRKRGAEIIPFSPLNDEAPAAGSDFIFLPGGYPELHLPRLSNAQKFRHGVRDAAKNGVWVYGECGGFMTLGQTIIDADGTVFPMLGLLDLETSFAARQLHLGYRILQAKRPLDWLSRTAISAHEFHYTTAVSSKGDPLFSASDAAGAPLPDIGLVRGTVAGSYAHVIA